MKKTTLLLLSSVMALVIAMGTVAFYLGYQYSHSKASDQGIDVVYEVKPGVSFNSMANEFERMGLVRSAYFFSIYARIVGDRSKVKVGEYLLRTDMVPSDILKVITSGKSIERSFTISEGLNLYEISALYEKEGFGKSDSFWHLTHDQKLIKSLLGEERESLEGYLFPETYRLTKYTDTRTLILNMVKRFLYVYNEVQPMGEIKGLNRHQFVTLASIIEKETGAPIERPVISAVFHNRLAKNMKLQTDPTVIYGKADKTGKYEIVISRQDLLTPTRFNTYTMFGLPPGPIGNPGRESLLAAMKPDKSKYFFFVSQNNGTHIFSEDYQAHQKAVQRFQLNSKAREGKSWRDLNKKSDSAVKR
jgi:UPF0755 protein